MFLGFLDVEFDAETWGVPDFDVAVFDDGVGQAIHDVVPPLGFAGRIFERDVVAWEGCGEVDVCGDSDDAVGDAVGSHEDAVHVRILCDPLEFGDSSDVERVGADHSYGLRFDEVFEVLAEVDLLAGMDRCGGLYGYLAEEFWENVRSVVAGDGVFEPHDVEWFERFGEP